MAYVGNLSAANTHDYDGDGFGDILWWNNSGGGTNTGTGDNTVEYWSTASGETTPTAKVLGIVDPTQFHFIGTGDFNADGTTDIAWQAKGAFGGLNDGDVVFWAMDTSGTAHAQVFGNALGYDPEAM